MGMTIIKSKKKDGQYFEGQKDTDMGDGEYYLYDVSEVDGEQEAELISSHKTEKKLKKAFACLKYK